MGGTTTGGTPGSGRVSMESGVLRVDGRPFFPLRHSLPGRTVDASEATGIQRRLVRSASHAGNLGRGRTPWNFG